MKKKGFWNRLFEVFDLLYLVLAVIVGLAAGYVLGGFFGMGLPGYALGFVLGVGLVLGAFSIG